MAAAAHGRGLSVTMRVESIMVRACAWLFFGVLFAVLPVFMDVMAEVTRGGSAAWAGAVALGLCSIAWVGGRELRDA